ncbi:hypothetical protein GcM3_016016 [Golovinomyces cichoracearum]|uniref:Secreted effector protein n=1 Tax=Golovinomyces cichoracearum TaxID=62708 RepID=A0A420J8M2_9PEZI|nr:hypothetical protein GcM3_016016 [Golovinomyces cichoracearum]
MFSVTNCVALFVTFCILLVPTESMRLNSYGYDVQCEQNSKIDVNFINRAAKIVCGHIRANSKVPIETSEESVLKVGNSNPRSNRMIYDLSYLRKEIIDFQHFLVCEWDARRDTCTARGMFASRKGSKDRWKCEDIIPGQFANLSLLRSQSEKTHNYFLDATSPSNENTLSVVTRTPQFNVKCWNEKVISKKVIEEVASKGCLKVYQQKHGPSLRTHGSDRSPQVVPYTGFYFDKAKNLFMFMMPTIAGAVSPVSYNVVIEWDDQNKKCIPHGVILRTENNIYSKCDEIV